MGSLTEWPRLSEGQFIQTSAPSQKTSHADLLTSSYSNVARVQFNNPEHIDPNQLITEQTKLNNMLVNLITDLTQNPLKADVRSALSQCETYNDYHSTYFKLSHEVGATTELHEIMHCNNSNNASLIKKLERLLRKLLESKT